MKSWCAINSSIKYFKDILSIKDAAVQESEFLKYVCIQFDPSQVLSSASKIKIAIERFEEKTREIMVRKKSFSKDC